MKVSLATVLILLFAMNLSFSAASAADGCDSVLLQQAAAVKEDQSLLMAYLNLVSSENYENVKKNASALVPGYFDGSYSSFNAKRSKLYTDQRYSLSIENSRDEFKSYLTPDQVSGWIECKRQSNVQQLIVYYKDVDAIGATLVVQWNGGAAGALNKLRVTLSPGATSLSELESLTSLSGTYQTPIARPSANAALRGTVSGEAGPAHVAFSESFYLPPFKNETKEAPPPRYVVDQRGVTRSSIGYWAGGKRSARFECITVPDNMELIVISDHQKWFGKTRAYSRCLGPARGGSFCDSAGEGCADVIIDEGCIVNKDWLNWYRAKEASLGVKATDHAICGI